jgi:hypothetical protein
MILDACRLCRALETEPAKKRIPSNGYSWGTGYTILPTKDKKGHKHRYMIVSNVHEEYNAEHDDRALGELIQFMLQFGVDFTIMQPTFASIKRHWHLVASTLEENAMDVAQIQNTPRIEIKVRYTL